MISTNTANMKLFLLCMIIAANLIKVESTVNTGNQYLDCKSYPMTLSIGVDASSSIRRSDLPKIESFLNHLSGRFNLSSDFETGVRIGIFQYNGGWTYSANSEFFEYATGIEWRNRRLSVYDHIHDANMTIAIKYMYENHFHPHITRPSVAKIGIVLTNQPTNSIVSSAIAVNIAKEADIILLLVGMSNRTCIIELTEIIGNESWAFKVESFDQLNSIIGNLENQICSELRQYYGPIQPDYKVCEQKPLEIGIVLDASSSIHVPEFTTSLIFLQKLIRKFVVSNAPNGVRVSVIPYASSNYYTRGFNLTTYNTTEQVETAIRNITFFQGDATYTGAAIKYMHTVLMAHNIVRPGVRKIGIVLTDGDSSDKRLVISASQAAREDNITMFAIGIKKKIGREELIKIAGNESHVFQVSDFGKLRFIINELANRTCLMSEDVVEEEPPSCGLQYPGEVLFVYSPDDLCSDTQTAIEIVKRTMYSSGMQGEFRYGVITGVSLTEDVGFDLKRVRDIPTNMSSTFTTPRLRLLAQSIKQNSFEVEGDRETRNWVQKVVVFISNSKATLNSLLIPITTLPLSGTRRVFVYIGPEEGEFSSVVTLYASIIELDSTERLMEDFPKILSEKLKAHICRSLA